MQIIFISKYPGDTLLQLEPRGETLKRFVDIWFRRMGQTYKGGFAFFRSTWLLSFIIQGRRAFWPIFFVLPKKAWALGPSVTLGDGLLTHSS